MARYYGLDYDSGVQRGGREGPRGFFKRAEDAARSWFGHEDAERWRDSDQYEIERRRRQGDYRRPNYSINDLRVGDMMSRDMLTVQPDDRIGYAARLMRDWDCGALPVIDQNGSLIGMLTDRDITMRLVANDADTRRTTVGECMTDGAYACQADDSIRECMRQMARHQIRRLPVVNNYGQVIGIISQSDLARHAGVYPGQGARRSMADVLCAISEPSRYARR